MSNKKLEMAKRIAKAETRIAGLHSIDEHLDLGNGLTLDNHRATLEELRAKVHRYNQQLADLHALAVECRQLGRSLDNWNSRMTAAVGLQYGHDSIEYGKAGGKRLSERRRPARKGGKAAGGAHA